MNDDSNGMALAAQASSAVELRAQVQRIQQLMEAVMIEGVHYGVIPGTDKPSLWKAGAEVLCTAFHIAPMYDVVDLGDQRTARYRVTCTGRHQATEIILGQGLGECSSDEAKYQWRAAVGPREFAATDPTNKREKFKREGSDEIVIMQIRVPFADIGNTCLKMAAKRAHIAMTLNVTAASDCFTQDLEDLPEGMEGSERSKRREQDRNTSSHKPQATSGSKQFATDAQLKLIATRLDKAGIQEKDFLKGMQIAAVAELPFPQVDAALEWIRKNAP